MAEGVEMGDLKHALATMGMMGMMGMEMMGMRMGMRRVMRSAGVAAGVVERQRANTGDGV